MPGYMTVIIIFIFLVLVANTVLLVIRISRNRSPYGRRGRKAPTEEFAMKRRNEIVYRRIHAEQERIRRYLELRDKTWALYEEVRQRHSADEENETK